MPTQQQVQQVILSAQLTAANLVNANGVILVGGGNVIETMWERPTWLRLNSNALQRHYNLGDYVSATVQTLYNCLLSLIGIDTTVNFIDPNFQTAGITIDVVEGGSGFKPTFLTFTDVNLVSDGQGGYYLPCTGATGLVIIAVTINEIGIDGWTPVYTFNPPNIYGFANNTPTQTIVVSCI